ncbi:MAG: alpha/beta hydrolase [Devosia nanyangense]|uniref:Alpha/beta hydrolase n=1 Tax=Devosia nanyangense TaxID=1228055 RepID=A0A933L0Q2_9HYPH|nr:alpha/beta hydrolase [Devosia nanyangense]
MAFVTSKDGTRIGYSVVGSGPALILIDGAMCWRSSGPATPLAEELKDRFTVYTYDRRGRGESGDTKPYATAREVEDLDAVIDAAGGSAMVYAISSGAALALEAAGTGSRITKMVLYEAPFILDKSRPLGDAAYVSRMEELVARGDKAGAIKHFMRNGVQIPAFGVFMMQLMGVMKKMAPVAPTLPYDTALTAPFQIGEPLPPGLWPKATMPVLDIGGGKSDAWMQSAQVAISKALPNATHKTLPGQNHMVAPAAIAPLIREFLAA